MRMLTLEICLKLLVKFGDLPGLTHNGHHSIALRVAVTAGYTWQFTQHP